MFGELTRPSLTRERALSWARGRSRRLAPCLAGALLACAAGGISGTAHAQAAPPSPHDDSAFDFMNLLSQHGLHDLEDERWNAYGQFTFIGSYKAPFSRGVPYNVNGSSNSLLPTGEGSYTGTATLFFGLGLWEGAGAYIVPEIIAERPLSGLHGLGGSIQNFELQKTGSETPQIYRSRTFLRQTIGLGGEREALTSDPMQLSRLVDRRRVVITVGNFTILDVFDRSKVNWDPRQTFLNMAFMTHSSWDFPSDARGYSWGATVELLWDDWAVRYGRITPPQDPNGLPVDFRLWKYYGDQIELEHDHKILGQGGSVQIVGFRNHVDVGRFSDAIAAFNANPSQDNAANCGSSYHYESTNADAPDLCFVRKGNVKLGIGVHVEQYVTTDIGLFARAMYADGRTEVDAYNPADRSASIGAVAKGTLWRRPFDVAGVGAGLSWISHAHAQYLAMGGVDGFVGDGYLRQGAEGTSELFYSVNLARALWLTADYQHLWNPGFNTARGPVDIVGGRIHAEF